MYENVRIDGTVRIENAPEVPVEKPYLKTPAGIANAGILICNLVICTVVFGAQLQGTSNGYWASFLSIIGILFNGPTFALDLVKRKKYATLILPILLQLLFSVLWTFFFFTSAVDSAVRGARGHNGYFGSISILSFVNMFFYAVNVYFKFKSVEEEDNQTNSNSQQSIKDRVLDFFNKGEKANGHLDSKTIDGLTHDEGMVRLEQEKERKDATN